MKNWYQIYKQSEKAVPPWEDLQKMGPSKSKSQIFDIEREVKDIRRRDKFTKNVSWAIPTENVIKKIKNFIGGSRVLEIAAGRGLWSKILQNYGVHVTPIDNFSGYGNKNINKEQLYTKIPYMTSEDAVKTYSADVLLIIWPPYECDMAANAVKLFKGNKIIYIGEGSGGCNANDDFFGTLGGNWQEVDKIGKGYWKKVDPYDWEREIDSEAQIPQWPGINDTISFYQRSTNGKFLDILSLVDCKCKIKKTAQQQKLDETVNQELKRLMEEWEKRGIESYVYASKGNIYLSQIVVPKENRNQGMGTKAMHELVEVATKWNMKILLTPSVDFGGSSVKRLEKFYKGFGFKNNKGRSKDYKFQDRMIWHPNQYSTGG
jgi:GNAT superfamily N-acetyltransferase